MLKLFYNKAMIDKAKALVAETNDMKRPEANEHMSERCGLTVQYLKGIGKSYHHPSNRVVMNMGYEVYIKDLATGEFSKMEMDYKCDWNPTNPRMNPTSSKVFVNVPDSTTITNE